MISIKVMCFVWRASCFTLSPYVTLSWPCILIGLNKCKFPPRDFDWGSDLADGDICSNWPACRIWREQTWNYSSLWLCASWIIKCAEISTSLIYFNLSGRRCLQIGPNSLCISSRKFGKIQKMDRSEGNVKESRRVNRIGSPCFVLHGEALRSCVQPARGLQLTTCFLL